MQNNDIISVLKDFSVENWNSWIEDILKKNVAFPISNLSPDGDVLKEMLIYIERENVSSAKYKEAIYVVLKKHYDFKFDTLIVERLLEVAIVTKDAMFKDIYKSIFFNKEINDTKGKFDYLNSKSLQGLSRIVLSEEEKREIYEFGLLVWINKNISIPSLVGNFLRFVRLQLKSETFFNVFSYVIIEQDSSINQQIQRKMASVLIDKIRELHFYNTANFYSSLFHWFIKDYTKIKSSIIFKIIAEKIDSLFMQKPFVDQINITISEEAEFGQAVLFITGLLLNENSLEKYPLKETIKCFDTICKQRGRKVVEDILLERPQLIVENIAVYSTKYLVHNKRNEYESLEKVSIDVRSLIENVLLIFFSKERKPMYGKNNLYTKNVHKYLLSGITSPN
jgi:hypothetical protein